MNLADLNALIQFPLIHRLMIRPINVNSTAYDIPYVSGMSADATKIYLDRDLTEWVFLGERIPIARFLILYEMVKRAIYDALTTEPSSKDAQRIRMVLSMTDADDHPYHHAALAASIAEDHAVELQHRSGGVKSYRDFVKRSGKDSQSSCITNVPRDLDMLPYLSADKDDTDERRSLVELMTRCRAG